MRERLRWLAAALLLNLASCSSDGADSSDSDPVDSDDERDAETDDDDDDNDQPPDAGSARDGASSARTDAATGGRDASASPNLDAAPTRDDASMRDAAANGSDARVPASDAEVSPEPDASGAAFALSSSVVEAGGTIPSMFRCMAPSPPLAWTRGPSGTESYAILFQDEENDYYHWVIYDIPKDTLSLPMAVPTGAMPPMLMGAKQGPIYNRSLGYAGPCYPAAGMLRPYAFTLYAMKTATLQGLAANASAMQIASAVASNSLASTKLSIRSVAP